MHHSLILQEVLRMQIDMLSLRSFEERLNSSNMHVSLFVAGVHLLVLPLSLQAASCWKEAEELL
jgi:hypothetical protein